MYPLLRPTIDNKFIVEEDYIIYGITVPKNYKTNGANIFRLFWIIIPPFKPKFLGAVVVHDYLTDKEEYKLADDKFEEILFAVEKSFITKSMVYTVRKYHRIRYGVK